MRILMNGVFEFVQPRNNDKRKYLAAQLTTRRQLTRFILGLVNTMRKINSRYMPRQSFDLLLIWNNNDTDNAKDNIN